MLLFQFLCDYLFVLFCFVSARGTGIKCAGRRSLLTPYINICLPPPAFPVLGGGRRDWGLERGCMG